MSDWKYDLDDLEAEEAVEREPLEPESPSVENAAFLLLGVVAAGAAVLLAL